MTVRDAPINRNLVDEALPWLRGLLGVTFVAYSANSTISLGAKHLMWLFEGTNRITIGSFQDAYWYSAAFALILFVGEVATSERYPRTYRLFLLPDIFYTALGVQVALSKALGILTSSFVGEGDAAVVIGQILSLPFSAIFGYIIAKWGEVLLFGRRRRPVRGTARKDD